MSLTDDLTTVCAKDAGGHGGMTLEPDGPAWMCVQWAEPRYIGFGIDIFEAIAVCAEMIRTRGGGAA